jgi:murein DD-endopeptidase MepM/ murein hydrolase activator NlpD
MIRLVVSVRPALASVIGLCSILTLAPASAHGDPSAPPPWTETTTQTISPGAAHSATVTIGKGNTLLALLRSQHLDRGYCQAVINALDQKIDVKHLHIGDTLSFDLADAGGIHVLKSIGIASRKNTPLTIQLPPELWQVTVQHHEVFGEVGKNVAASLSKAGLPATLVSEIGAAMKYDRDLAGMLKPSSQFRVGYQQARFGQKNVASATLENLSLITGTLEHRLYAYQAGNSKALVDANGKGIAWLHFQKPVLNARLSSPYGWRVHPVFGDWRFHYGIDLATSEGAPVSAAADGVVIAAGWHGDYGQFVRIQHGLGVETTYGHLSKIAALKPGDHVAGGQVIGAVGETGVATGPHLYYEVAIAGQRIDPLKMPAAIPVSLSGKQLASLHQHIEQAARN